MIKAELLKTRDEIKSRKPAFIRQDIHKKKRLGKKWKKPKGLHNKLRCGYSGHRKKVEVGYRMPEELKGIIKGLKARLVSNKKELERVDARYEGALITGTIGNRKRVEILKEAMNKGIIVLNVKDPAGYIKQIGEGMAKKKEEKKKKEGKKKEVKKEKVEKKEEIKLDEEEKKKKEKEEKDKLLTKRA